MAPEARPNGTKMIKVEEMEGKTYGNVILMGRGKASKLPTIV